MQLVGLHGILLTEVLILMQRVRWSTLVGDEICRWVTLLHGSALVHRIDHTLQRFFAGLCAHNLFSGQIL